MTIIRNLVTQLHNQGEAVLVEVWNNHNRVYTCSVPNTSDGFIDVTDIDRKLADALFHRTTAYKNHSRGLMTFVVDYYGN